ncbi:MAG: sigma-70 family RNA polymerase sigma factor [Opitutales bacterium]|nr:sigma-70 family RNA polymerase sigma factor [Opitutales bacterium]
MPSSSTNFNPDEIVRDVIGGNKDRFRLLVKEYGLLVRGYLSARVYHLEDAEDLAQETFVLTFSKLSSYELGTNFRAWLLSIAKFQLSNHWRKTKGRANTMEKFRHDIADAIQPEMMKASNELEKERIAKLLACISKLPGRTRHLIRAGLDGVRVETLAEEMKVKPNAIYQSRHRAHIALRKCMETNEPTPAT